MRSSRLFRTENVPILRSGFQIVTLNVDDNKSSIYTEQSAQQVTGVNFEYLQCSPSTLPTYPVLTWKQEENNSDNDSHEKFSVSMQDDDEASEDENPTTDFDVVSQKEMDSLPEEFQERDAILSAEIKKIKDDLKKLEDKRIKLEKVRDELLIQTNQNKMIITTTNDNSPPTGEEPEGDEEETHQNISSCSSTRGKDEESDVDKTAPLCKTLPLQDDEEVPVNFRLVDKTRAVFLVDKDNESNEGPDGIKRKFVDKIKVKDAAVMVRPGLFKTNSSVFVGHKEADQEEDQADDSKEHSGEIGAEETPTQKQPLAEDGVNVDTKKSSLDRKEGESKTSCSNLILILPLADISEGRFFTTLSTILLTRLKFLLEAKLRLQLVYDRGK